jgi:ABC-type microcin C transport system permease subunit YejB
MDVGYLIGAVVAMASVLLVFQMGQPIWMSMSRDVFAVSQSTSKYKTLTYATIVTGFVVPALLLNLTLVTDLCSGTLFAFVLVCAGVLCYKTKPIFLVENSKLLMLIRNLFCQF